MDLMSTGLSGLRAASSGIAGTANNIANGATPDFRATRVDQGNSLPNLAPSPDLATELTNLKVQAGAYKANLKVIQTANEILGSALDLKA